MDQRIEELAGNVQLPENATMLTSVILMAQYIDENGHERRASYIRTSGNEGIGTWQLVGILEMTKIDLIAEHNGRLRGPDDD